jgi:hypothetical protein
MPSRVRGDARDSSVTIMWLIVILLAILGAISIWVYLTGPRAQGGAAPAVPSLGAMLAETPTTQSTEIGLHGLPLTPVKRPSIVSVGEGGLHPDVRFVTLRQGPKYEA